MYVWLISAGFGLCLGWLVRGAHDNWQDRHMVRKVAQLIADGCFDARTQDEIAELDRMMGDGQ